MTAAHAPDPRIGLVLQDRYRIVRKLGEGGMGAVYEGEHILIKRRVAIKCLHSQYAQNPEIVARFHREALAATSIGHQNIIEVTDMGRFDDGSVFMVLEFLDGRDWSHDIDREGAQPIGKVVEIVDQICDALTAAHAKGIIHRDLKPENVFLIKRHNTNNFVKVLDFGISKFKDTADGPSRGMTQTGATLGTPYYMAPEQAQGKKDIDHRADIYALGVMLFQALTGQYPFDDESYPMLVLKICTEPAPKLRTYRPDLPEELERIVDKLLSKSPADRFATCEELKHALQPYARIVDKPEVAVDAPSTANMQSSVLATQRSAGPIGTPAPSEPPSAPPVNRTPLYVGAALIAVTGVGMGVAAAAGVFGGGGETTSGEQQTATTTLPAAAAVPSEPVAIEPTTIRASVFVEPMGPGIELRIDGQRVLNPVLNGQLPRKPDGQTYRIEASRPGYDPLDESLPISDGQSIRIQLWETTAASSRMASASPMRSTIVVEAAPERPILPDTAARPHVAAMIEPPAPMVSAMVEAPAPMEAPVTITVQEQMVEVTMTDMGATRLDLSMAF